MTIAVGISEVYNKSTSRVRVLKWVTLYINPDLDLDPDLIKARIRKIINFTYSEQQKYISCLKFTFLLSFFSTPDFMVLSLINCNSEHDAHVWVKIGNLEIKGFSFKLAENVLSNHLIYMFNLQLESLKKQLCLSMGYCRNCMPLHTIVISLLNNYNN